MTSKHSIRVATDVGGTFTDLVSVEINPKTKKTSIKTAKTDTTPPDFETGVLSVINKAGLDTRAIEFFAHGTTVVINAITERKGARVGLITTAGFKDTLEIARGNRPDFFNLNYQKPKAFVPRHLRKELPGRVSYKGEEMAPHDLSPLAGILAEFKEKKVEAIAVCFLHAYADTSHEARTTRKIKELWPEVAVVASHQITREWREYERTSTAVMSAYVQPVAERYLRRLHDGLTKEGFAGNPYIMQSNCGVDSLQAVSQTPITMIESGPASGFLGAAKIGELIDEPNILALDIGGTTAKCSLIENSQVRVMTDYWVERDKVTAGYPIMVPVVDLVEIGNGGGSIAWVDEFNKLHVGPQSAGALPGPAAYGKGGDSATTTDANLMLGRINQEYFCGGEIDADMSAVKSVIKNIANKLGVSSTDAARGIIRIANNNMVNALKLISLNRGFDPRDFTMIAFGGGGAMHAVALAQELGVKKVVIPQGAAVFSAWGMLLSDIRRDYFITHLADFNEESVTRLEQLFNDTEQQAIAQFSKEGIETKHVTFYRYGKFRYQNQEHTTEVLIQDKITTTSLATIEANFHSAYEREYTYRLDTPVELVGIHVVASAAVGKLTLQPQEQVAGDASACIKNKRTVDYALDGIHTAQIYDGTALKPGMQFMGPAIIEDPGTTIVIHPNNDVLVDAYSNIIITINT